jgi:hypothetical protein
MVTGASVMRILAFTDFHDSDEAFWNAERLVRNDNWSCVIVAGDIANYDDEIAKQRLTQLGDAGVPLLFVPGNMDDPELAFWPGTKSVHPLHGKSKIIQGVFFIGLGGSPRGSFSTPFQLPEERAMQLMNQALAGFTDDILVLVSHCPPKNTKLDVVPSGEHAGSMAVRSFVEKMKPVLVISGHVHEAIGIDSIGETTLVNTGPARSGNYAEITLEDNVRPSVRLANFL